MEKSRNNSKIIILIISLLAIAIIGSFLSFYSISGLGPGLGPDTAAYVAGAKNIINGNGISILYLDKEAKIPLNLWASSSDPGEPQIFHWPPFYSVILSIFEYLDLDIINAGAILNNIIFGLSIFLTGLSVYLLTNKYIFSVFSSLMVMSAYVILILHSMIMSEGVFLLASLLGFLFLSMFLEGKRYYLIILSSIFISIASLTRYIGLSLVAASFIMLMFFYKSNIKNKIINIASFLLITIIPMTIWIIRTSSIGSDLTDRRLAFHPVTVEELKNIPGVINQWFFISIEDWIVNLIILIVILGLLLFLSIYLLRKNKTRKDIDKIKRTFWLIIIFSISYIIMLFISRSFFDAKIPVAQDRLLFPIYISILFSVILVLYLLFESFRSKTLKIVIYVFLVLLLGLNFFSGYRWLVDSHENGQGYTRKYIIESELIEKVDSLPDDKIIYSDATDIIYLYTGRLSYTIPSIYDPYAMKENFSYQEQFEDMVNRIKSGKGVIVDFDFLERPFLPNIFKIKETTSVCPLGIYQIGGIYEICPEKNNIILKTDYSNFGDYWLPLNQCEFKYQDKDVIIDISGEDPWFESRFSFEKIKNLEPYLSVIIEVGSYSQLRIYFGRDGKDYFHEDSYSYPLVEGRNEVVLKIIDFENVDKIRIDPVNKNEDCIIKSMILYAGK